MITNGANRWWGNGIVALNNNSSVPYPELYQRAIGNDVDLDNDGRFTITVRARLSIRQSHPAS